MNEIVKSRIALLESILKELVEASYSTLCESNGVSDNEWTIKGDKAVPEWPVPSFYKAIQKLNAAWEKGRDYFEPIEAEKRQRWENACATAEYIMDRLKEDRTGKEHPNRIDSHLSRNIADAINGTLVVTMEERKAGARPETMTDRLNQLLASGELVEWKSDPTDGETGKLKPVYSETIARLRAALVQSFKYLDQIGEAQVKMHLKDGDLEI